MSGAVYPPRRQTKGSNGAFGNHSCMTILIIVLFGLVLGSFLSMVFSRLEVTEGNSRTAASKRRSRAKIKAAITGRSRCDHCGTQIAWYDNIPLVSWLLLRGRCRHCRRPISHYHPVLEASSALYLVSAYLYYGFSPQFFVASVFGLIMLLLFAYDLKHQLIPNVIVVPAIGLALALLVYQFGIFSQTGSGALGLGPADPISYLIGGGALGAFFLLLSLASSGEWIGGGDIKLGALIGLLLGWPFVIVALVVAYLVGTAYAVLLLASKQASLKTSVPFGPMLVMGYFIALYYGPQIVTWYQGLVL